MADWIHNFWKNFLRFFNHSFAWTDLISDQMAQILSSFHEKLDQSIFERMTQNFFPEIGYFDEQWAWEILREWFARAARSTGLDTARWGVQRARQVPYHHCQTFALPGLLIAAAN